MAMGLREVAIATITMVTVVVVIITVFALLNKSENNPKSHLIDLHKKIQDKSGRFDRPDTEIPENIQYAFSDLKNMLEITGNTNCILEHQTPDLGDYVIKFLQDADSTTAFLFNKDGAQVDFEELSTKICIYDGTTATLPASLTFSTDVISTDTTKTLHFNNLIYFDKNQNTCFIADCDKECLHQAIYEQRTNLCDDVFSNVFYKNTYFGTIADWRRDPGRSGKWKYTGSDPRVPAQYKASQFGISHSDFSQAFDLTTIQDEDHKSHEDPGVWIHDVTAYYDTVDTWCFQEGSFLQRDWWIYQGTDDRAEKRISKNEKVEIFGGLKKDPNAAC